MGVHEGDRDAGDTAASQLCREGAAEGTEHKAFGISALSGQVTEWRREVGDGSLGQVTEGLGAYYQEFSLTSEANE